MIVDYEEKVYENYFNIELSRLGSIFPIGQVAEGILGFDAGAYLNPHARSAVFMRKQCRCCASRRWDGVRFSEITHMFSNRCNTIPNIKLNALFQYKKPEFLNSRNAKEWGDWKSSYYRYHIYAKQQNILNRIAMCLGDKIIALYAAPAIAEWNELVQTAEEQKIIEMSNLIEVKKIASHSRVTYIDGAHPAHLHSKVEEGEQFNLIAFLEKREKTYTKNIEDVINFIVSSGKAVEEIIEALKLEKLFTVYAQGYESYIDYKDEYQKIKYYLLLMKILADITGSEWYFIQ